MHAVGTRGMVEAYLTERSGNIKKMPNCPASSFSRKPFVCNAPIKFGTPPRSDLEYEADVWLSPVDAEEVRRRFQPKDAVDVSKAGVLFAGDSGKGTCEQDGVCEAVAAASCARRQVQGDGTGMVLGLGGEGARDVVIVDVEGEALGDLEWRLPADEEVLLFGRRSTAELGW